MLEILITAIIAFIVTYLAIPVVINIANTKKLFDIPDERKLHTHAIASLGGIGVFLGLIVSCLLMLRFSVYPEFQYLLAAAFIIFFIGLKDDIILISATKKFIAQIIVAAIIIHLADIRIENFYGVFGIGEVPSTYGVPITYITIILIINAYNLIDGIDGLAGSLGLFATLTFGTYFLLAQMPAYAIFSFALSASLMAFLIFNYNPAKIFMGDSGSLLLGMVCAILVLKFINVAGSSTAAIPITSAVALGMSIIIIPLIDTLRVFGIRILRGRSPFSPDRNHVHHLLLDRGLGHSSVTFACVSANIVLVLLTYMARSLGNTVLILSLFAISFAVLTVLYYTLPKRKMVIHRRNTLNSAKSIRPVITSKVINLATKEQVKVEQL